MLSTADASTTTTVERMIGRVRNGFTAPTCIIEYNQFMQGVDRMDQLRSRFSIADAHTFKKWHKKLALAYIDIARCNAYIARKMTGVYVNARDCPSHVLERVMPREQYCSHNCYNVYSD